MALILQDRVKEVSNSSGTGSITLAGAYTGYRTFNSCVANGSTVYYTIHNTTAPNDGEWEVGVGTFTAPATLSRDTVLSSSNGGSKTVFSSASDLEVFITQPAGEAVYINQATNKVEAFGNGANTITFTNINTTNLVANTVTLTAGTISTPPNAATDIVNKTYVDDLVLSGTHFHEPVLVEEDIPLVAVYAQPNGAANGVGATLTNSGSNVALVVDGVTVSNTARILVYAQSNAVQNGVYTVTNPGNASAQWVLTRSTDTDTYGLASSTELSEGSTFFVTAGNTGAGRTYTCNTQGTITFGTTNITFAQISSAQIYSAGTGLNLSNLTFSISNTAVTAGTYGNAGAVSQFTVNAQGQITNAANVSINASSITLGTLDNARTTAASANGASTIVLRDSTGSFNANVVTATTVNATTVNATTGNFTNITANAVGLTDINASNITSGTISNARTTGNTANSASTIVLRDASGNFGANVITATFSGNAAGLSAINASNISSGTIDNARTTAASANGASTIVARDSSGSFTANTGTFTSVSGNGIGLTAINASNIASGTIANARTTASSSNGTSTIVLRGASGEFAAGAITGASFSGDGSAITAINATAITTGTIANARTTASSANGASTIVARDAGGNFSANTITATTFSGGFSGGAINATSITDSGNLTFTGTGNRILGDFNNATIASRVMFQGSVANGATVVSAIPNGTNQSTQLVAINNSDPTNAQLGQLFINASEVRLASAAYGTGTSGYLPLTMYTGGSERLRIDTSGNVGIGTSSPNGRLSVLSPSTAQAIAIWNRTSDNIYGGIYFKTSDGATDQCIIQNERAGTNGASLLLYTKADGGSALERMRIDSSGNVGIGNSSPASRLDVTGPSGVTSFTSGTALGITVRGSTALTDYSGIDFRSAAAGSGSVIVGRIGLIAAAAGSFLSFGTSNNYASAGVTNTAMTIDPSGNVGIGNSGAAASFRLQIGINSAVSTAAPETLSLGGTFSSTAGANGKIRVWTDGTQYMGIGVSSNQLDYINTAGYSHVWYTNAAERMRLDANGNLLVGTAASTYNQSGRGVIEVNGSSDSLIGWRRAGANPFYIHNNASGIDQWNVSNTYIRFGTNNAERMRITSGGNLGLGTTNPLAKLVVSDGSNRNIEFGYTGGVAANYFESIDRTGGGTSLDFAYFANNHRFYTGGAERMRITSGGDVGIGTNLPGGRLEVQGSSSGPLIRINNPTGSTADWGCDATGTYWQIYGESFRWLNGLATERMRITDAGNVLIGTTTVVSTLTVNGDIDANFFINSRTISANYTVPANFNAMTAGPITINAGITVTVSTGSVWVVI
jgi:hypothetical protein